MAIVVFFSFLLPSFFLGYTSFASAKERIIADVNQALVKTVLQNKPERITPDTLRVFKSNLRISSLKATSYLALCTEEPSKLSFCSDTVSFKRAVVHPGLPQLLQRHHLQPLGTGTARHVAGHEHALGHVLLGLPAKEKVRVNVHRPCRADGSVWQPVFLHQHGTVLQRGQRGDLFHSHATLVHAGTDDQ